MKKTLSKIIITITAIISVVIILRVGKVVLAKAIYGEKVFDFIVEKSTEDHNIADCLLFSKDQTIWDIDRIIIDITDTHSGAFDSKITDPYKGHFLTQLDKGNPDAPIYKIIKDAIAAELKKQGITAIRPIPIYSSAELWRTGKGKLLKENNPHTIHIGIYSYRSTKTINNPEVTLEFLFYRAKSHGRPEIAKTESLKILLNDPEEQSVAKISEKIQRDVSPSFYRRCIRYPQASNCYPAAKSVRIFLEKLF